MKAPAGVGLVRTLQNPRGGGTRPHNPPSTFAPRSTCFAGKIAVSCRLRNHHVFEGNRANTPRPRSKALARAFTRSSTQRSTFLANQLHKLGSPQRRAPGALQRGGCSRLSPLCCSHTHLSRRPGDVTDLFGEHVRARARERIHPKRQLCEANAAAGRRTEISL